MKKTTSLLLLMLFTVMGFSQNTVSETGGANEPIDYGTSSNFMLAACSESNPGNAFENGLRTSRDSLDIVANDLTVLACQDSFSLEQITATFFSNGNIVDVDVAYYADAAGVPGALIGSETGVVPSSDVIVGSNFGFDVHEIVLDVYSVCVRRYRSRHGLLGFPTSGEYRCKWQYLLGNDHSKWQW